MKLGKIVAILVSIYVLIVIAFEASIGYFQPTNEGTLVLGVTDASGEQQQRVLSRIEHDGEEYVAVNHWPRQWYHRTLENPSVSVTFDGVTREAIAIEVTSDEEIARLKEARPVGLVFRLLTGFPPRRFVRLDALPEAEDEPRDWPIELESPDEVADIEKLDSAIMRISEGVMSCLAGQSTSAEQCRCEQQEVIDEARVVFEQTLENHPAWEGQSVLWWQDDSKSYSYNLNMAGLAAEFARDCP